MNQLLNKILTTSAPPGSEHSLTKLLTDELTPFVDKIYVDRLGNLIMRKTGAGKRVMICAHMDESAFIITFVEDSGFLRAHPMGNVDIQSYIGSRVCFKNGINGIVCTDGQAKKENLYIDIGTKDKQETLEKISIGDVCCIAPNAIIQGTKVLSKALDNKLGCFVLAGVIKEIKNTKNDLFFVFSAQGKLGARGAKPAAFEIEPDYAVVVDAADADEKKSDITLGGGIAIKIKDNIIVSHKKMVDAIRTACEQEKAPFRYEISAQNTDAGVIHTTKSGCITGGIGIPVRYIDTPDQMAQLSDINNAVSVLRALLEKEFD